MAENIFIMNKVIPIDMSGAYLTTSRFATNIVAQLSSTHVTLNFFESKPWITTGTFEEQKALVENLSIIPAECVGRIVLPHEVAKGLLVHLSEVVKMMETFQSSEQKK